MRIERIISHGHASPEGFWYDQGQSEWVVVLKGAARLQFEDGTVEMKVEHSSVQEASGRLDDAGRADCVAWRAIQRQPGGHR